MNSMRHLRGQGNAAAQGGTESEGQSHFRQSGPAGQSQPSHGGSLRQMGGLGMLLHHTEDFNITEEQEEKLSRMKVQFELEKIDLQAALRKARVIFRALARDHASSEQDVMDAIDKLASSEAELRKMRYRHLKASHGVLDEDQRSSLKTYHKNQTREKIKSLRLAQKGQAG